MSPERRDGEAASRYGMRTSRLFNEGWDFSAGAAPAEKVSVSLPHSAELPALPDGEGRKSCRCAYAKKWKAPEDAGTDRFYLEFRAVSGTAEVYVNGAFLTRHEGGFSCFRADMTEALVPDGRENEIEVHVECPCGEEDETVLGGMWGDVYLLRVPSSHFDLDSWGTKGMTASARVFNGKALCIARAEVTEPGGLEVMFTVEGEGAPEPVKVPAENAELSFFLEEPKFWNGVSGPYLYVITAVLLDGDMELDRIDTEFGIRTYYADPDAGFHLNDKPYPLRGVCRSGSEEGKGRISDRLMMEEDISLILESGANCVRLTGGQPDDFFLTLCDRAGIAVWAETAPCYGTSSDATDSALAQMRELVLQGQYHPSVICWGLGDLTAGGSAVPGAERLLRRLNDVCHFLDSERFTALSLPADTAPDSPLARIADLRALDLGFTAEGRNAGEVLDAFRDANPDLAVGVSGFPLTVPDVAFAAVKEREYLFASFAGDLFGGEAVSADRKTRLDPFYACRAWLSAAPFVRICGGRDRSLKGKQMTVKVYSCLPFVELYVNGKSFGRKEGSGAFVFSDVPLRLGKNTLRAVSGGCEDTVTVRRKLGRADR